MANKPSKDERPFEFLETPVASSSPARMGKSLATRQMALVATGPEGDLGPTQRLTSLSFSRPNSVWAGSYVNMRHRPFLWEEVTARTRICQGTHSPFKSEASASLLTSHIDVLSLV